MEERKCEVPGYYCQEFCYLLKLVESQSQTGGKDDINAPPLEAKAGRYWEKSVWQDFTQRCRKNALKGCPFKKELEEKIKEITREKEEKGELFTKKNH